MESKDAKEPLNFWIKCASRSKMCTKPLCWAGLVCWFVAISMTEIKDLQDSRGKVENRNCMGWLDDSVRLPVTFCVAQSDST